MRNDIDLHRYCRFSHLLFLQLFFFCIFYDKFVWCRTERKFRVAFDNPVGLPFVGNEKNDALLMVFYNHSAVNVLQILIIVAVRLNPAGY